MLSLGRIEYRKIGIISAFIEYPRDKITGLDFFCRFVSAEDHGVLRVWGKEGGEFAQYSS